MNKFDSYKNNKKDNYLTILLKSFARIMLILFF